MHLFPVIHPAGWGSLWGIDLSSIISITVTCLVVFIIARLGVRRLSVDKPSKTQNFVEWIVDFVHYVIKSNMDIKLGKKFVMLGITLIMYLFVGNLLGLPFNVITETKEPVSVFGHQIVSQEKIQEEQTAYLKDHPNDTALENFHGVAVSWWKSPAADVNVTLSLATLIILLVHYLGLTTNTRSYLLHYLEPRQLLPLSFFLNIIKEIAKYLTLNLRLWGNIFAGEILITVILGMGAFSTIPLVIWLGYSTFVGIIQSFIFTMLTMVYLSMVLNHGEEHGH